MRPTAAGVLRAPTLLVDVPRYHVHKGCWFTLYLYHRWLAPFNSMPLAAARSPDCHCSSSGTRHALVVESRELGLGHDVHIKDPMGLVPARSAVSVSTRAREAPRGLCLARVYRVARADVPINATRLLRSRASAACQLSSRRTASSGTALAVFDASLNVLHWTWLLNDPEKQVAEWGLRRQRRRKYADLNTSDYWIPRGASGAFPPPWARRRMMLGCSSMATMERYSRPLCGCATVASRVPLQCRRCT